MEKLLTMLNDRWFADSLVDHFEAVAKIQDNPEFYQTILGALKIDEYYVYSDDHRDWKLGEAQTKVRNFCHMMLRGVPPHWGTSTQHNLKWEY